MRKHVPSTNFAKKKKKNPTDYFQYVIAFNDFCFMNKRAVYDKALLLLLNH